MRQALRALAARPGFVAIVVATLTLGFGVNAAIFSLTRTVLMRPLPYPDAEQLVQIAEAQLSRGISYAGPAPANYVEWRPRTSVFSDMAAWRVVYFGLNDPSTHIRAQGALVEPGFFRLLGVVPSQGRAFAEEDSQPGHDDVVILGRSFWFRQFGGDPSVIGRTMTVDGTRCTIVGVLPDSFKFFRVLNHELDLWRPLVIDRTDRERSVSVYARLKPGAPVEAARAELADIYRGLPAEAFRDGVTPTIAPLAVRLRATQRPILLALEASVVLVLCIGAANIGNLMLAVAAGRRKELAVRIALGATRWQLARDVGRETLLLALAGAAGGLMLAVWTVDVLNGAVSYQDINRLEPFRVDGLVVVFTLGLAAATAGFFALLPSRRAAAADVTDALKESSHGVTASPPNRRLRAALVVAELAFAIVLLTSALELTRGSFRLEGMDRGVDVPHVMTAQLSLNGAQFDDSRNMTRFADRLLPRLRVAGIDAASIVNYPPLSLIGTGVAVAIEGRPAPPSGQEPALQYWIVAPGYFKTLGIPVVSGRDFTVDDTVDRQGVAIVSRRAAERHWGRLDVVGEHLRTLFPQSNAHWIPRALRGQLTIVGVVNDVREDGIPGAPADRIPQLYLPYAQNPTRIVTIVARASGPAAGAVPIIRAAVREADPDQPTFEERSLEEIRRETFARQRELAILAGLFAAMAVVLTAVGVYGVVAYLTAARTREIRIRLALGATQANVVALVVADAMKLAAVGVVAGMVAAPWAFRILNASVPQLQSWSAMNLAAVAALLTLVCAAAAFVPGWRACCSVATHGQTADPI